MVDSALEWLAVYLLLVVGVLLILIALLALRRRLLERRGAFDLSLRMGRSLLGGGWIFGLGRYRGDRIEWFRMFSLSPRPKRIFIRRRLSVQRRRPLEETETYDVPVGHVVLVCRDGDEPLEMSMTEEAVTGLLAWLEAAPPGENLVA